MSDSRLNREFDELLNYYFEKLGSALTCDKERAKEIESEWRQLVPICFADFERFLRGWSPSGHRKLTGFAGKMTKEAIADLKE